MRGGGINNLALNGLWINYVKYIVRNYEESDKENVAGLIQSVWDENARKRFNEYYSWYQQHPVVHSLNPARALVVDKAGQVVGYTRFIHSVYKVGDRHLDAYYIVDNATLQVHRGSGVKLLKHILATQGKLLIGAPLYRAGLLWEKLAKKPVKVKLVERCVLVLRPSIFLREKGVPLFVGRLADVIWKVKLKVMSLLLKGSNQEPQLNIKNTAILPHPDQLNALFEKFSSDFYVIAKRNHDYMRWRFIESPIEYKYIWLWQKDTLVGYAVFRIIKIKNRNAVLIVEMIAVGEKKRNYGAIIDRVIAYGMKNGCADIQTLFSGCDEAWQALKHLGTVRRVEQEELSAFSVPYIPEIYGDIKWFVSLAESDYEFVMYS